MNKKVFTVNGMELAMLKPTAKIRINAQLVYNKAWAEAEKNGSPLARNLDDVAKRHGVWDDEKNARVTALESEIISLERTLRAGATKLHSKEEGRQTALKIRELRLERYQLLRAKDDLYVYTAENYADNARIGYFVSQGCVYNDTGKPYFKSYDDYLEQSENDVVKEALSAYFQLMTEDIPDETFNLYENQWLKKYNYVDDKGRLINDKGQLIDSEGKTIDEDYNYVDNEGRRVDRDGYLLTKDGNYDIPYVEFS